MYKFKGISIAVLVTIAAIAAISLLVQSEEFDVFATWITIPALLLSVTNVISNVIDEARNRIKRQIDFLEEKLESQRQLIRYSKRHLKTLPQDQTAYDFEKSKLEKYEQDFKATKGCSQKLTNLKENNFVLTALFAISFSAILLCPILLLFGILPSLIIVQLPTLTFIALLITAGDSLFKSHIVDIVVASMEKQHDRRLARHKLFQAIDKRRLLFSILCLFLLLVAIAASYIGLTAILQ